MPREVEKLTDRKWMNLYKVVEPEFGVGGFEYAERIGADSVAFMIYNKDTEKFMLTNPEYNGRLRDGRSMRRLPIGQVAQTIGLSERDKNLSRCYADIPC